jgi:hypothetical protein
LVIIIVIAIITSARPGRVPQFCLRSGVTATPLSYSRFNI